MSAVLLGTPVVRAPTIEVASGETVVNAALPRTRVSGRDGAALDVISVGLACCAPEVVSALAMAPPGPAGEPVRTILVLAGTVTVSQVAGLAELAKGCDVVISYGACADSGGPYWDSPVVNSGSGITVDAFVPGCPPTPDQLLACLSTL